MSTIFVSIASYRDKLCSTTMIHLFENAKYPKNVIVGVCEQNDAHQDKDRACIVPKEHPLYGIIKKNIRKVSIPHHLAKGPTYARFICASLYKDEDFFMQIDSHTYFIRDWDQHLLDMFRGIESRGHNKVIISHYPPDVQDYDPHPNHKEMVTYMKNVRINVHGIPVFGGARFKTPPSHPERNYYISANFLIARSSILNDVPFDPHLPFLFEGEEILYSLRAYTKGYNVFSPNRNIVFHYYVRKGEPKFWDDLETKNKDSILKVKYYLGYPVTLDQIKDAQVRNSVSKYGLGKERSVQSYWKVTGIPMSYNRPQLRTMWVWLIVLGLFFVLGMIIVLWILG